MHELYGEFTKWRDRLLKKVKEHPLEMITWEITRNCNLNCEHCGSPRETWDPNRELETVEVISLCEKIAKSFDITRLKYINFTGGEPLVRKDILEIFQVVKDLGFKNITLTTNGIKLAETPKLLEEIIKRGVTGIGIDVDGTKDIHDRFRGVKGAFDKAMRCVGLITNKELKNRLLSTINTVVSQRNINQLEKIWEIVQKYEPDRWRLIPAIPIGRGSCASFLLQPEQYINMFIFIRKLRASQKIIEIELGCGDWLGMKLEGQLRSYIWHCASGINTMGIYYDGGVGGCTNIPTTYIEGNVRTDEITEVWNNQYKKYRNFDWRKTGQCIDCNQWEFCHGGPMHRRREDGTLSYCVYKDVVHNRVSPKK